MKTYALVLAAGKGTRMKSNLPKVMHTISGLPMIEHIVRKLENINVDKIFIITGHGSDIIKNHFGNDRVEFIDQKEQLGTAHAVMQAKEKLKDLSGKTLILTGDTPLISEETISSLVQKSALSDGTVLTTIEENPYGYGRIIRDTDKKILRITEEKDASFDEKIIKEVNTGIFCFNNELLFKHLSEIENNNNQKEYYLTDIVDVFLKNKLNFDSFTTRNPLEVMGINDRFQLSVAQKYHQELIKRKHMLNGISFANPETVFIEEDVHIEQNVLIENNVVLKGNTFIDESSIIRSNSEIINSKIGKKTEIISSLISESEIGNSSKIGPFAHIRPESNILDNVKIGNFVEIKKSTIDSFTKISHLSYIGDADIGKNVNIGCGSITVNYDGKKKYKTIIKDNSFVGCNVNLIAPITLEKNTLIAAGSTLTSNVPENALAIARQKQINKENYKK